MEDGLQEGMNLLPLHANDNEVTKQKIQAYIDVIELFVKFSDAKLQKQTSQSQKQIAKLGNKLADIGIRVSLFGSYAVVKSYVDFRLLTFGEGSPDAVMDGFAKVVLAMRDDLHGNRPYRISADFVLATFLTMDDAELKADGS